ncbi:hypothetical protein [Phocaeicola barnesiae]|uniref:hypothetical protein n=1 Tax=Phocaeicola barnesiae TaxID=376804 RepID=UPI0025A42E17|nr:hypothetical protein [Phocaeicola barnesiae]MDM8254899.1 hypothetical protein [Phocaeicola barnesiae]
MRTRSINNPVCYAVLRMFILMLLVLSAGDIRSFASEQGDSDSILAVLFPNGKAIGQPYTRNCTDIRMVRVFSEDEAYGIFRRLCGKEYIFPVSDGKYHYHACLLAKPYTGYLLYSFHVKPDTYEVGVIYVHSPELRKLGIKELHLVKAIKIKK